MLDSAVLSLQPVCSSLPPSYLKASLQVGWAWQTRAMSSQEAPYSRARAAWGRGRVRQVQKCLLLLLLLYKSTLDNLDISFD